jgi:hypothetical protein
VAPSVSQPASSSKQKAAVRSSKPELPIQSSLDGSFMGPVPAVPLRGSPSAPLFDLLAWHAEVLTSEREHVTAAAALSTASARRSTAWSQYFQLLGARHADDESGLASEGVSKERASPDEGDVESESDGFEERAGGMDLS